MKCKKCQWYEDNIKAAELECSPMVAELKIAYAEHLVEHDFLNSDVVHTTDIEESQFQDSLNGNSNA